MQKVSVFNTISLDGYFTGVNGDMSWAHENTSDQEWQDFVSGNSGGGGTLLFGRVTYQMMESFWPTPQAAQLMPEVAKGMNRHAKVVFSRSLEDVTWENTTLVKSNLVEAVRRMKQKPGEGMVILGSGTIVAQLAAAGLIDSYQFVIAPLALGKGRTLFDGVPARVNMRHTSTRTFQNGKVVVTYESVK